MKKKFLLVFAAFFLFSMSRLLYIFFQNETDLLSDLKLIEGHYSGTVADSLLDGLIMPYWDYQFSSYDGGTLIAGLVIAPFFMLLGSTAFAVSAYSLFNTLVIFFLWIGFVYRYFGGRTAVFIGLLFIFAPPNHIKESLIAGGNHIEINFFIILVIWYFFKIFYRPQTAFKRPPGVISRDFLSLGFWAGLGVFYCYSSAVLLLVCFLFWLTLDKQGLQKRNYLYLCLAFLLGISCIFPRLAVFRPLIAQEMLMQWPLANLTEILPRISGVLFIQLPKLMAVTSPVHYAAYFIFLAGFIFICVNHRKAFLRQCRAFLPIKKFKVNLDDSNKTIFFILFIAVYLLIYTISNFNTSLIPENVLQLRYLWLLFPFIFMMTALALDYLYSRSIPGKRTAAGILFYFVLATIFSFGQQLDFNEYKSKLARRLKSPGYAYEMLGTVVCSRFALIPPKSLELLNRVPEEHIPMMYRGFGYEFSISGYSHLETFRPQIRHQRLKEELYKGYLLGDIIRKNFSQTIMETAYIYEVAAVNACVDPQTHVRRLWHYLDTFHGQDKNQVYYGLGAVLAVQCGLKEQAALFFLKDKHPDVVTAFTNGVAYGVDFNTRILPNL